MATPASGRDPVEKLAEEFVERYRQGERPALAEYTARYPELAEQIRALFPALVEMEQLASVDGPNTRPHTPAGSGNGSPPQQLGEYRILREIGHGGMGVVYEAVQESLGRHVALKVLPLHGLLSPTQRERFRREAKAAARLHHTNIVPVFGVGEDDGVHYYAMQFIQGQGLDMVLEEVRRLRAGPGPATPAGPAPGRELSECVAKGLLTGQFACPERDAAKALAAQTASTVCARPVGPEISPDQPPTGHGSTLLEGDGRSRLTDLTESQYFRSVAQVGVQVAEALAYAHRQGILHRDIKPSNLLLDRAGTVWVTDFGLAKADDSDDLTQTGDLVGTLRFMAPERFQEKSDRPSDVYGLGITLYELLTLRPAFEEGNRARLIERVTHEEPPRPHKLDPCIPRDLETIVLKAMAKDPAARYPTAEALAEDLRCFLADRPIRARRTSLYERTWRWCRRNPAVASLLTAVGVLLATVAAVSTFSAVELNNALDDTRKAERKARLREAEALVGQAHGTRYSRRPGQRFEALAALEKAAAIGRELGQPPEWFDRLRNEAIAALALPDIHITHTWAGFPPGTFSAELSQDFRLYARTNKQGACSVRRVANDVEIAQLPELGEPATAKFGPGRLLVLYGESSRRVQLWNLAGPKPILRLEQGAVRSYDLRPDGRLFVLRDINGSFAVYATDTGVCKYRLAPDGIKEWQPLALHPTEPIVATCSHSSRWYQIRDLRTGAVLVSWRGSGNPAWSPDGRTLAVADTASGRVDVYTFDPAARSLGLTRILRGPEIGGAWVHFNPAGDRLAIRGWGGEVHLFDVHTGRPLFSTPLLPSSSGLRLQFDLTGTRLAAARVGTQEQQIGLWSVADARQYRALVHAGPGQSEPEFALPAVHPSGRLTAQSFKNGFALFDLETGRELAFVKGRGGRQTVCFDDTGNLLTNGFSGFFRWPVGPDPTRPGRIRVGPPERLPFYPGDHVIAASRDGQVIAQAMFGAYGMAQYAGGWILHPKAPQPRRVEAGVGMGWASVSPDGRWAAFGVHLHRVNVYEAATRRRAWQSPDDEGHDYCCFSRDGRWLVTDNDGGRAYRVGTWKPGPQLGAGKPWDVSPDGRLVVLGLADGVYRLVELATGRELARLEDPEQTHGAAVFTPDGTRLVGCARDGLRVWDLRRIRAELVKLGLDWDAPPYTEADKAAPGPFEVRVVGAELIDPKKMAEHQRDRAVFDLYLTPFDGKAHYRLGTYLLGAGKPGPAYAHLTAALAFRPNSPEAFYRRAWAAFRLKRWADAADDASRYLEHYPDSHPTRFLRARAYRLSHRFDEAVQDLNALIKRFPRNPKLYELRACCQQALGHTDRAKADREQAIKLAPNDPRMLNNQAWRLVTGPEGMRDPAKALQIIRQALKQKPGDATLLNTLGVVQYRNQQYKEAVTTLEKSLAASKGKFDGFDLFFLAMCHHHLRNAAKARNCYDRAVKWGRGKKDLPAQNAEELKTFQAEADKLLRRRQRGTGEER
jgi:serine/threonine protein kinase/tetratricopeptide (TPR) repeat protein/WD40 repeat protein